MPIFIFYKIVCKDENIKDCYVGKTKNLKKRWNCHKNTCNNENNKKYNLKLYQFIRENGGWNNFNMIEIEKNEYDDKDSAIRERYWIEELNANLNCIIPSRTKNEYCENYKEHLKEYKKEYNKKYNKEYYEDNIEKIKQYYENNKEKIKETHKIYRENNIEKIKKTHNKYYQNNKEILKEYRKRHYENNKEKIICECGCEITKVSLSRHLKSKKHIDLMI